MTSQSSTRVAFLIVACATISQLHAAVNVESTATVSENKPTPGLAHVPAIVQLPGGVFRAFWIEGATTDGARDVQIATATRALGTTVWSAKSEVSFNSGATVDSNPVPFIFPDGKLWCFSYRNDTPDRPIEENGYIRHRTSSDGGATWSADVVIPNPVFAATTGTICATMPLVLTNGDWILPANRESYDPNAAGQWYSVFFRSRDSGASWQQISEVHVPTPVPYAGGIGAIQPSTVQLADGRLMALFRPRGTSDPANNNRLWQSYSSDGGVTWSTLVKTGIANCSKRSALLRSAGGSLVLITNNHASDARELALLISTDDGVTWGGRTVIDGSGGYNLYPYAVQGSDGRIHCVYSHSDTASAVHAIRCVVVDIGENVVSPPGGGDTTAPSAIGGFNDTGVITAGSVGLTWTAPGDDGMSGTATSYQVRFGTGGAITTLAAWNAATPTGGAPTPASPGTTQGMTVTGLVADTVYAFAVRAVDEAGNLGALSGPCTAKTLVASGDTTPPATISTLALSGATATGATITWTAPGDDGATGTATTYLVRYAVTTIASDADWNAAVALTPTPAPVAAGAVQTMTVGGLAGGSTYHVVVRAMDEAGNTGGRSNVLTVTTAVAGGGGAGSGAASENGGGSCGLGSGAVAAALLGLSCMSLFWRSVTTAASQPLHVEVSPDERTSLKQPSRTSSARNHS